MDMQQPQYVYAAPLPVHPRILQQLQHNRQSRQRCLQYARDSNEWTACQRACGAEVYASLGLIAWAYLPVEFKRNLFDGWNEIYNALRTQMNDHAVTEALESLARSCETLSHIAVIEVLGFFEDFDDFMSVDPEIVEQNRQLLENVDFFLVEWTTNGIVGRYDQTGQQVLTMVRHLLKAGVGFAPLVVTMSKALMVWPTEHFETNSRSLQMFMADQRAYLTAPDRALQLVAQRLRYIVNVMQAALQPGR